MTWRNYKIHQGDVVSLVAIAGSYPSKRSTVFNSIKTVLMFLSLVLTPIVAQAKPVWIDVRTEAEHQQNHIDGDPLIQHTNIVAQVTGQFPDKDTEIHLYCRSGNRAGKAKSALESAGYTNVKNRGSVAEAREARDL